MTNPDRVRHARIQLAIAACAYELYAEPTMSDDDFDALATRVCGELQIETGRPDLDVWFRENVTPFTAMWIHDHPELEQLCLVTECVLGKRSWSSPKPLTPGRARELDNRMADAVASVARVEQADLFG